MIENSEMIDVELGEDIELSVSLEENVNELTVGFDNTDLARVAYTNDYYDLDNIPSLDSYALKTEIPTLTSQLTNNSGYLTQHQTLKTVNGESLIGNGNIVIQGGGSSVTKLSELENDTGFITAEYHDATKQDVINDLVTIRNGASKGATALQSVPETYAKKTDIPNLTGYATEQWVEGKGYLTQHQSLTNYATQSWVNQQGFLKLSDLEDLDGGEY